MYRLAQLFFTVSKCEMKNPMLFSRVSVPYDFMSSKSGFSSVVCFRVASGLSGSINELGGRKQVQNPKNRPNSIWIQIHENTLPNCALTRASGELSTRRLRTALINISKLVQLIISPGAPNWNLGEGVSGGCRLPFMLSNFFLQASIVFAPKSRPARCD